MSTNVVPLQEPRANILAGGKPMAIVPQSMDDAYRLAKAVCMAQMAPKGLDTPEKAMVAIMHGLEVGLTPMAALQRIAVVNGRPTIWGDGAIGLVRASGACEYIHEKIEGHGDAQVAICEAKRRGEVEPIRRTFSVADAKKAGLWNKAGPWQQFPARMLQMRARAFSLRDGFADVLGGLYLREEIEDERQPIQPPAPPSTSAPMIEHRTAPEPRQPPTPPSPPHPVATDAGEIPPDLDRRTKPAPVAEPGGDPEALFKRIEERLSAVTDPYELATAWEEVCPDFVRDELFPPDAEHAISIFRRHEARLEP